MGARVVIIGGGPAGSACALGLAARGFDVTVVESKAFPRVKVCGEFVSPAATGVLQSLVSTSELRTCGARMVDELVVEEGTRELRWKMPEAAWVLSRRGLDEVLLEKVKSCGVRVVQPGTVRGVEYRSGDVLIDVVSHGVTSPDLVIHADGSGRHDPAGPTPMRAGVVGRKCHLRVPYGVAGLRMRACDGAYVGLVQVEGGLATCALVARNDVIARYGGHGDAMLAALWPEFDPAWRVSEWLSCGVAGSGYIRPGHARSFRVGNAAAAVEPVGGEGIGLALWSGHSLARMLEPGDLRRTQERFARMYEQRLRWRRMACRAAAEMLMRPRVVRAVWPLVSAGRAGRALIGAWYGLSGKAMWAR